MQLLGLLGIFAFTATSLVVGLRLVWLSSTTRQFPEFAVGASFLLAGFVSLALNLAVTHAGLSPTAVMWTTLAAAAFGDVGYALLAAFVWRVFRPGGFAGKIGFALCVSGLAVGLGTHMWLMEPLEVLIATSGFWITLVFQIVIYSWATLESFSYWRMMRRRVAIGAGDPLLANRFGLWSLATGAIIGIWLHLGWTRLWSESAALNSGDYLVIATLGFTSAAACWLAFLPPSAYRRHLERSAT